jgi:ferritin
LGEGAIFFAFQSSFFSPRTAREIERALIYIVLPLYSTQEEDMLSTTLAKAFNEQIGKEMSSAYLYLSLSTQASAQGWTGFANWFLVQYHEESFHAMKLYNFLLDQGASVSWAAIPAQTESFKDPLAMMRKTLEHEGFVTKSIHDLASQAQAEGDHAAYALLQWYAKEQVEEEKNAGDLVRELELVGGNTGALFMLDAHLKGRQVSVQTDFSKGVAWG